MKHTQHIIIAAALVAMATTGYAQRARECTRQEQIALAIWEQNEAILQQQQYWIDQQQSAEWAIQRQQRIEEANYLYQQRMEREDYWAAVRAYRAQLWREQHPGEDK